MLHSSLLLSAGLAFISFIPQVSALLFFRKSSELYSNLLIPLSSPQKSTSTSSPYSSPQRAPILSPRMDMPDSSPSPPPEEASPESTWSLSQGLPVSYRVAIALDVFVLLITIAALIFLALYIRRQYWRRHMGLLADHGSEDGSEGGEKEAEDEVRKGKLRKSLRRKVGGHERWGSESGQWELKTGRVRGGQGASGHERCGSFDPEVRHEGGSRVVDGVGSRDERERQKRFEERVKAGYDGFRGN